MKLIKDNNNVNVINLMRNLGYWMYAINAAGGLYGPITTGDLDHGTIQNVVFAKSQCLS